MKFAVETPLCLNVWRALQFAHVLDFTLRFDEMKMCTPAVQNDFSYYRRALSRDSVAYAAVNNAVRREYGDLFCAVLLWRMLQGASNDEDDEPVIGVDLANTLTFFYAEPTPMLGALRRGTETFVKSHPQLPIDNTTDMLATMANMCRCMVHMP